ncbi:MAG: aldehyde ferredoxin oxidoreductase C-terminal domain-containing protein, partial [Alphaproteobacteria bacterium]
IKCSNVFVDDKGEELVSPMEYETIGLMGTNCGLDHPDDVARVNHVANDLGIDTIEAGATIAVLMDAGEGEFGDVDFMMRVLEDIRAGNERGRLFAQGTARVGAHYKVGRVPAIKKQGISAYDPRVIEVTGISMMVTAQGADHTAGNLPTFRSKGVPTADLVEASLDIQIKSATQDSLGLCIFGRSVTLVQTQLIIDALNDAHGTDLDPSFLETLGREAIEMEWKFNKEAGLTDDDDELPEFFYTEPLAPTGAAARHHTAEVNKAFRALVEK